MTRITPQRSLSEQFPRLADGGGRRQARELERLRANAHRFATEHVRPRALEIDRRTGEDPSWFDWDLVRAGAQHGMLNFLIPKPAAGTAASPCRPPSSWRSCAPPVRGSR